MGVLLINLVGVTHIMSLFFLMRTELFDHLLTIWYCFCFCSPQCDRIWLCSYSCLMYEWNGILFKGFFHLSVCTYAQPWYFPCCTSFNEALTKHNVKTGLPVGRNVLVCISLQEFQLLYWIVLCFVINSGKKKSLCSYVTEKVLSFYI